MAYGIHHHTNINAKVNRLNKFVCNSNSLPLPLHSFSGFEFDLDSVSAFLLLV